MATYYVNTNAQPNGDHEVHRSDCNYLPQQTNRLYLGEYISCRDAVARARAYYNKVNGCYYCSRECHTS